MSSSRHSWYMGLFDFFKKTKKSAFRQEHHRIVPSDFSKVEFCLQIEGGKRLPVKVINISNGGIAFSQIENQDFKIDQEFLGYFKFNSLHAISSPLLSPTQDFFEFQVPAKVVHISHGVVGLCFLDRPAEFAEVMRVCFPIETLVVNLRLIDPKILKEEQGVSPTWMVDALGNEIYLVIKDGKVLNFHFTFMGNYVEGGEGKYLKTGHLISENNEDSIAINKASSVIEFNSQIKAETLLQAKELLRACRNLSNAQRELVLGYLK